MINFKPNLKKRNFLFTILLVAGFLTSNFESNIKSNDDLMEAGISILNITGVFDGESGNTHIEAFGFTIYDGQKAAARKQARQARRAARRAARK